MNLLQAHLFVVVWVNKKVKILNKIVDRI